MHIQLLCLSHDCHMTSDKAVQLADCLHADIRRIFLSLQFCVSTSHTLTSLSGRTLSHTLCHFSLFILALTQRYSTPSFPPHLSLPWHTLKPHLLTSDLYRNIDMASHKSEQDSYMDLVSMDTSSGGGHMTRDDLIFRPWWRCKEEAAGVLDELPERESQWREEEMEEGVCGKLGRGIRPHHDPISWSQFTRSAVHLSLSLSPHTHTLWSPQTCAECEAVSGEVFPSLSPPQLPGGRGHRRPAAPEGHLQQREPETTQPHKEEVIT